MPLLPTQNYVFVLLSIAPSIDLFEMRVRGEYISFALSLFLFSELEVLVPSILSIVCSIHISFAFPKDQLSTLVVSFDVPWTFGKYVLLIVFSLNKMGKVFRMVCFQCSLKSFFLY